MARIFNTNGPVLPEEHYRIDPLTRIDLTEIISQIDQKKYFFIHAPANTGKTSFLIELNKHLNNSGTYKSLYINIKPAQKAKKNVAQGMEKIIDILAESAANDLDDSYIKDNRSSILKKSKGQNPLQNILKFWSKDSEKPVVLLIDELDALAGDTLISVLHQLRTGYNNRPKLFPQSILLSGHRDINDYRIYSDERKTTISGANAFNIKAQSFKISNFDLDTIKQFYYQHTKETGQKFAGDIFPLVWELTGGQPWLVNALVYETCFNMKEAGDGKVVITKELINKAAESIILRRKTHLPQLPEKLKEKAVQNVIIPILASSSQAWKIPAEDLKYVLDLGLITEKPVLKVANKIYREIIPRELTYTSQGELSLQTAWYINEDGRLKMGKLVGEFQDYFRKHFDSWVEGNAYKEVGPLLLFQAFLQKIIDGNGNIERDYGMELMRTDIHLSWPHPKGTQEIVLELKYRYGDLDNTIKKGVQQTWKYMEKSGAREGYLLIFDWRKDIPWQERIFKRTETHKNTRIYVFGM